MAHPVAEQLDMLMCVLLAYVKDVCQEKGEGAGGGGGSGRLVVLA